MSRSVADATRFTATSPHAFSKPVTARFSAAKVAASRSNTISPQSKPSVPPSSQNQPGPVETPAQKVARLRAAHAAKRASEISAWDRVVVRSREMADSAHRITVMGLVLLTVIAGGVTVFSLGDMIVYNRRKKREWYDEQRRQWQESMAIAIKAEADGTATDDQILLLNQERAMAVAEEEKKKRKGVWKRIKSVFSSEGLKAEEEPFNKESIYETPAPADQIPDVNKSMDNESSENSLLQAIEDKRREVERTAEGQGQGPGYLDKVAAEATEAVSSKSKSWYGWFSR